MTHRTAEIQEEYVDVDVCLGDYDNTITELIFVVEMFEDDVKFDEQAFTDYDKAEKVAMQWEANNGSYAG